MKSDFLNIDVGILIIRSGLGLSFVTFHGLPHLLKGPEAWKLLGYSLNYLGIYFFPAWWGFLASLFLIIGGILLFIGYFHRFAIFLLIPVLFIALIRDFTNTGINGALYPAVILLVLIGLLYTDPGRYRLIRRRNV